MSEQGRIAEIRERWACVSPTPWRPMEATPGHDPDWGIMARGDQGVFAECFAEARIKGQLDREQARDNAEAIANAPADIAWLLAERDRLASEAEHWRHEAARADAGRDYWQAERDRLADQPDWASRRCDGCRWWNERRGEDWGRCLRSVEEPGPSDPMRAPWWLRTRRNHCCRAWQAKEQGK